MVPLRVAFVVFSVTVTINVEFPEAYVGLNAIHESDVDAVHVPSVSIAIDCVELLSVNDKLIGVKPNDLLFWVTGIVLVLPPIKIETTPLRWLTDMFSVTETLSVAFPSPLVGDIDIHDSEVDAFYFPSDVRLTFSVLALLVNANSEGVTLMLFPDCLTLMVV